MAAVLTSAPAVEPVCLADAKAHLKVDHLNEDALISGLIEAARQLVETKTGVSMVTQSWSVFFDAWPDDGKIDLPVWPVQSVTALTTFSQDDSASTVDPALYKADLVSRPARIVLDATWSWPSPGRRVNGISVDVVAGYAADGDGVPDALGLAVMQLVSHWYDNRDAVQFGVSAHPVPLAVNALLAPFRRVTL